MDWKVEFIRFQSSSRTGATNVCGLFSFGLYWRRSMSSSPCRKGNGRNRMESITENTALFAPMPNAKVKMTTAEKTGDLRIKRDANLKFMANVSRTGI